MAFDAVLERWAEGMDYCAVAVPARITTALGTKRAVLVMAQVNESKPFQVSLFPVGGGRHSIRIKSKVRQETNTATGDRVRIRFKVLDRADIDMPDDLVARLQAEGLAEAFDRLAPGKRNFIVRRIGEAVKPATRSKRIEDAVLAARRHPAP